jgi:hypothetical protein
VEKKMNTTLSRHNDHLLLWLSVALLLVGVSLGDLGIVALYASIVSRLELVGFAFSFVLIGAGALFTAGRMRR